MQKKLLINGKLVAGQGDVEDVLNPATGKVIAKIGEASAGQVDAAVSAATDAFDGWSRTPPKDRAALLLKLADRIEAAGPELAGLESQNCGKPLPAALNDEIPAIADVFRFFAGAARTMTGAIAGEYLAGYTSMIRRDPVGVVASIAPWNYPLMMAAWKLGPALAAGNTAILKPSEQTPLTALALAEILAEIFPPGVVNIITGRGETVGVFQLESAGMRKALGEMHADRFEDIIALVALYRPGPMANIPTYCAVKLGDEEPDYIHPKIEPILKETFGVIIYQEQVMQIAQVLAGYSLGEADNLRRAMGKKIKAEMDAQRDRFVTGAVEGGVGKAMANEIFDLLAKFADYGFNKSHAAAYALIAYHTAWFKTHYPVEFLAASMTFDKSNTDKLAEFRDEARRMGVAVEPPSINRSGVDFDVAPGADGRLAIRYALSAVKGVGEGQAESIVASRGDRPFASLSDFARRLNPREVNKKVLENLACCGAFDELEPNRARALAAIEAILAAANRHAEDHKAGQNALFGGAEADDLAIPKTPPWPAAEVLRREFEAAGFFLSGHPLDAYASVLTRLRVTKWAEFVDAVKKGATAGRLAAVVLDRLERRTKSGSKMGVVQLSDVSGQYEAILFQEGLTQYRDLLEKGAALLLTLSASVEGEDVRARIVAAEPLGAAAARAQKGLRIFVRDDGPLDRIKDRLSSRGEGEVTLVLMRDAERDEIEIRLPGGYPVGPDVAGALKAIPGVIEVEHV